MFTLQTLGTQRGVTHPSLPALRHALLSAAGAALLLSSASAQMLHSNTRPEVVTVVVTMMMANCLQALYIYMCVCIHILNERGLLV